MFALLAVMGGWPAQAYAQQPRDFFSLLFGGLQQHNQPRFDESRRQRITITPQTDGASGSSSRRSRSSSRSDDAGASRGGRGWSGGGSALAYCVRSCDGRYFPLHGRPDGASDPNAVAQCSAFCPATATEVYYTSNSEQGIDGAVNKSGRAYASSPNAFVYRQRLVEGCSCTGSGQSVGIRHLDIKEDPTLRKGDIVMTSDGVRIFRSAKSKPPFREEDFVTPARFPDLSRDMRNRLNELTVASR